MPDTPTADALARALAHIDASAIPGAAYCDEATFSAVFAVARAAVVSHAAWDALYDYRAGSAEDADKAIDAADATLAAAIADLVRLATGAQGGEA